MTHDFDGRRSRPGGRTAETRAAVLEAARHLLADEGTAALTWDRLATASGVHRTTLYRRWGTPAGVVADLARSFDDDLPLRPAPTLAEELSGLCSAVGALLTAENAAMIRALVGWRDREVEAALAQFWRRRQAAVADALDRHGCRAPAEAVVRTLAGPLYYSALIERRIPDADDCRRAVTAALALDAAE